MELPLQDLLVKQLTQVHLVQRELPLPISYQHKLIQVHLQEMELLLQDLLVNQLTQVYLQLPELPQQVHLVILKIHQHLL